MKLIKKFFCVVNGWDCPYFKEDGSCSMVDDGDDPVFECDDAGCFYDGESEEGEYFVWEDENGNRYDAQELLEMGYHFVNGEPMMPLATEIERIKSDVADVGVKMMQGKTCAEIVKSILEEVLEHWDEEISSPPDFDEMATNGFRG